MIKLNCKICKQEFMVRKYREKTALYCSKSCHARDTVAGKNKQNNFFRCLYCRKDYQVPNSRTERTKYCSRLCQNRKQAEDTKLTGRFSGEKNHKYKGGIQIYRRIAKENLPWLCNRCNSTKNLMVHHKDDNRYNNVIENLEVICRSCHQKHHNAVLNLGVYAQRRKVVPSF